MLFDISPSRSREAFVVTDARGEKHSCRTPDELWDLLEQLVEDESMPKAQTTPASGRRTQTQVIVDDSERARRRNAARRPPTAGSGPRDPEKDRRDEERLSMVANLFIGARDPAETEIVSAVVSRTLGIARKIARSKPPRRREEEDDF